MRFTLALGLVAASIMGSGFPGCEEDGENLKGEPPPVKTFTSDKSGRFGTITLNPGGDQPTIHPSDKPEPQRVITRDLKTGTGPVARVGDRVTLYYLSVGYQSGKRLYYRWPPQNPLTTRLTRGEPWHEAVLGMRVGGWREMIIPAGLFDPSLALDYFVEMVRVNGRGDGEGKKTRGRS
jgi:peptidylprolyl isomerase